MIVKSPSYIKISCVNPLFFIIDKKNEYIEKGNEKKQKKNLTLVPTNEDKDTLKSM